MMDDRRRPTETRFAECSPPAHNASLFAESRSQNSENYKYCARNSVRLSSPARTPTTSSPQAGIRRSCASTSICNRIADDYPYSTSVNSVSFWPTTSSLPVALVDGCAGVFYRRNFTIQHAPPRKCVSPPLNFVPLLIGGGGGGGDGGGDYRCDDFRFCLPTSLFCRRLVGSAAQFDGRCDDSEFVSRHPAPAETFRRVPATSGVYLSHLDRQMTPQYVTAECKELSGQNTRIVTRAVYVFRLSRGVVDLIRTINNVISSYVDQ